mgnify:CR=1 FL=1
MRIAVGSDHRGNTIREKVIDYVKQLGHDAVDFGSYAEGPVDYPDIALKVATEVGQGQADRGILIRSDRQAWEVVREKMWSLFEAGTFTKWIPEGATARAADNRRGTL